MLVYCFSLSISLATPRDKHFSGIVHVALQSVSHLNLRPLACTWFASLIQAPHTLHSLPYGGTLALLARFEYVWYALCCIYTFLFFFNSLNRINLSAHNCSRIATYVMRHCDKGTSFIVAPTHHISRSEESALPKYRGIKSILGIASTGLIAHAQFGGSGSSSGRTALL